MEITAMQELFERLEYNFDSEIKKQKDWWVVFKARYIESEKQQLVNTYWDAYKEGQVSSDVTAEEYYNQKYNNDTTGTNSNISEEKL